jgi:hypothetical protein
MSIVAFLLGDWSVPVYMKLPKDAEKNIGARPTAGKGSELMIAYGKIKANPKGNISTVIARSWRYSSAGRCEGSGRCMLRGQSPELPTKQSTFECVVLKLPGGSLEVRHAPGIGGRCAMAVKRCG